MTEEDVSSIHKKEIDDGIRTTDNVNVESSKDSEGGAELNGLTADAQMSIQNDWWYEIKAHTKNTNMGDKEFPEEVSIPVAKSKPDPPQYIRKNPFKGQAVLDTQYVHDSLRILLGSWSKAANFTVSGPAGQAYGIQAPIDLPTKGTNYNFIFFAGPGILQQLVNSVINANFPALRNYLRIHPLELRVADFLSLTFRDIKDHSTLKCMYAAFSRSPDQELVWNLNVVLRFDGEIQGMTNLLGSDYDFRIVETNLAVCLQTQIDFTNPSTPNSAIKNLQFSVENSEIHGPIVGIIGLFSNFKQAAFLNSYPAVQDGLKNSIKDAIEKMFKGLSTDALTPVYDDDIPVQHKDRSTWMSTSNIQNKSIGDLQMPATHDSAAYNLSDELAAEETKFPDIAFLWKLDRGNAPPDHNFKSKDKFYLGEDMYKYVISQVKEISEAQSSNLHQQLQDGIRWFDIRAYYDKRLHDFYVYHGLRGARVRESLEDVRTFLDEHKTSQEIFFLNIHNCFAFNDERAAQFAKMIKDIIGPYLWYPEDASGVMGYDFSKVMNLKVSDIARNGPRAIFYTTDTGYTYRDTVMNTQGFPGDECVWFSLPNGPNSKDIAVNVMKNLFRPEGKNLLRRIAVKKNPDVTQYENRKFHFLAMDWYDAYNGVSPVDVIIETNNK